MRLAALICACLQAAAAPAAELQIPDTHPRLLIRRSDVAALRVRCGVAGYRDDPVARQLGLQVGADLDAFERLRVAADRVMLADPGADDLLAPAFMHLIAGQLGLPDRYTQYVTRCLLDPLTRRLDLDGLVALDLCWDAVPRDDRDRVAARVAETLAPIEPADSPLSHFTYHRRLLAAAGALVIHESRGFQERATEDRVARMLAAFDAHVAGPLVQFCRQRGGVPTSGENGVWEEADTVLALEIWRNGAGIDLWPELGGHVGRWMDHYFYADTEHPALDHGFIHDDGSLIPRRAGTVLRGFAPAVPWAIARRTKDPIATWCANRGFTSSPAGPTEIDRFCWVRLLYGPLDQPEAARRDAPLGRSFGGGWVAMRTGWEPGDTVLLFDAGQPYWRARQHFDAGQFQIHRKGRLAIDAGDDVTHEADLLKEGETLIGGKPGDWDHYYQATIAHNCVTVADPSVDMQLYGRTWIAMGNQRLIEHDYDPTRGDVNGTPRRTGRLTAFQTNVFFTYASADLSHAYPPQAVLAMQRSILTLTAGAVLVLDRVNAVRPNSRKTWHLQMQVLPRVQAADAFQDLAAAHQLHGVDATAGIWALGDDQPWLEMTHGEGRLFVRTLLPADAKRRVLGGPMKPRTIPAGPFAGQEYFGGDPLGYEHRLWPAWHLRAPNAAYTLGSPTSLGPQFGVGRTWGRLDVAPLGDAAEVTFLHLLIPTDATVPNPPDVKFALRDNLAALDLSLGGSGIHVDLGLAAEPPPGRVTIRSAASSTVLFDKPLATAVEDEAAGTTTPGP